MRMLWLLSSTVVLLLVLCTSVSARCDSALLEGSEMAASSSLSGKEAYQARLNDDGAWTARFSSAGQWLQVDLGEVYQVTQVATQGRAGSREWVAQYSLQYGFNGRDYMDYRGPQGGAWEFRGNMDGDSVFFNRLESPVVARFIRIRPTRWQERISLRLELYGCTFSAVTMHFNGAAFVEKSLVGREVHSLQDKLQFRFRTDQPDGVLVYSRGAQGDLLVIQLVENRLKITARLGAGRPSSLSVGSLLDDHLWHEVAVHREKSNLTLSVDRVRVFSEIQGVFHRLDLNDKLYMGGVPYVREGVDVPRNFSGCIQNFYLNNSNLMAELSSGNPIYSSYGGEWNCPAVHVVPLTFTDRSSFIKVDGNEGQQQVNISFSFRTYEPDGVMAYHDFNSAGYVKVLLRGGRLQVQVQTPGVPAVVLDPYEATFDDGSWHSLIVTLARNKAVIVLDGHPMFTRRRMQFTSGVEYLFGGGLSGAENSGFLGCMRSISAGGNEQSPLNLGPQNMVGAEHLLLDACAMEDRCWPNPCEHGGRCRQDARQFSCDCAHTGYAGAVCHTATSALSCQHHFQTSPSEQRRVRVLIDVDGSGPLAAFPVTCVHTPEGSVETHLEHDAGGNQLVDGFQRRGSFVQDVTYEADMRQVARLVNGSLSCRQELLYLCRRARLLNTPVRQDEPFLPFSWWVSRHNEPMDYWGGSQPGSRKCQCGITNTCVDPTKDCNCDAGRDREDSDGGELRVKEHLPVRQLRFGDTGVLADAKRGVFRLGALVCEGDAVFDNTVTFRLADATIDLPPVELGYSGDIYFEFRTTKESGTFLHVEGSDDFLKVSIIGGNAVQLEYRVGSIPLSVTVEVSGRLNDDTWHSVLVERNRKQARLLVDNALRSEADEPAGPVRSIQLSSKLVVGATTAYRDGFVGCLRALLVNGRLQELRSRAERGYRGRPLYGVSAGCLGKCASSPCLNNGTCVEGYSDYECNCRWTAFKGPICADEIGVSMTRGYMIKYELEGSYKTTIAEDIRVGFTTTSPSGFLLGLVSVITSEFMTIMVSNSGHIRVVFDFGFERRDIVYPDRIFNEGQFHDLRVRRLNGGATIQIQVDDYPPYEETFYVNPSADVQFNNVQFLYIGKNESMQTGFVGCISRVEFDDIYPLKLMFQENRPDNIVANTRKIHEDYCGIEPLRHPEEPQEERPPPEVDDSIVSSLYSELDWAALGGALAALLLAALLLACCLARRTSRRKGDYQTREDAGASDAEDADDAVAHGETGHQLLKVREFLL